MSRLEPLPIEVIEGAAVSVPDSPFPVLRKGAATPAGISAAEIVGATAPGAEAQRMDQLEKMLQEAQGRTETVEREAYDKAYRAGEKAGLALGGKRAEQIVESMESCLKQVESEASRMRQCCVDAVVDIAQLVVEQLVGDILEQQKDALFKAATRAAEQLPEISQLKLAVHPDDMQSFERLLQEERSDWRLYIDPTIIQGSCRLVSTHQDALIDPARAIADSIQHIRVTLHSGSTNPDRDEKDSENSDES